MADRYLLESGSPDGYQLENGSGVLLLETPPSSNYLWQVVPLLAAVALTACQPAEYRTASSQSWPFGRASAAASGVIPAKLPTQYVQVRSDSIRQPAAQSWPFGRVVTVAPTPQSFAFFKADQQRVTIEPEQVRQPARNSWPFGRVVSVAQQAQSFHFLRGVGSVQVEPEQVRQPPAAQWPFGRPVAAPVGVIPAQLPTQYVQVKSDSVRQPTPLTWPFGRTTAAVQPSQPFSIWYRPTRVTIEPEPWTVPNLFGVLPEGETTFSQPFSIWFKPTVIPPEVEAIRQPAQQSWPFGRVTGAVQASQPFSLWYRAPRVTIEPEWVNVPPPYGVMPVNAPALAQSFHFFKAQPSLTLEPEGFRQPVQPVWAFSRVAPVVPTQSFGFWRAVPSPRVEVEGYSIPPPGVWPYNRETPVLTQSFAFWRAIPSNRVEAEGYVVPPPAKWAHARLQVSQSWNWWQIQPAQKAPDTSQYYEYRSWDFGVRRLFWITPPPAYDIQRLVFAAGREQTIFTARYETLIFTAGRPPSFGVKRNDG